MVNLTTLVGTSGQIGDPQGVGTITDDDAPPTLSVNDVSVTEGNAGTTAATFTVSLSATSGKTVTVGWSTADVDAVQPVDYTAGSGTLTFVPGETSETIAVSANGDLVAELDEVFDVTLAAPSNATLGDATGVGTITDDELLPVIDIDEPTALEGSGSIVFAVSLSHQSASPVTVGWDTSAGTATNGVDYFDTNGTVTFAPLDTSETVEITVDEDGTLEHDETMGSTSRTQPAPRSVTRRASEPSRTTTTRRVFPSATSRSSRGTPGRRCSASPSPSQVTRISTPRSTSPRQVSRRRREPTTPTPLAR